MKRVTIATLLFASFVAAQEKESEMKKQLASRRLRQQKRHHQH